MRVAAFVLLGLLLGGAACPNDNCTPAATRCYLNRAQICGSDRNWRLLADCEDLGATTVDWACCWQGGDPGEGVPEGHTCLPTDECPPQPQEDGGE